MGSKVRSDRYFWCAGKREPAQDRFFREALDDKLWKPGEAERWDACWYTGMPAPAVFEQLGRGKFINHIPGNNALTIKSSLHATLARARERMLEQSGADTGGRLRFFPRVYSMPSDSYALQEAALAAPEQRWILKPRNSARGKGISMVRDVATVPLGDSWMVQEYVDNPHTMHGRKYVLRLYVLITCVEPLRVYLYREGSAKLASEPYDPDNIDNLYAHLTNPDVNATNQNSETPVVFLSLAKYRSWLREQGRDDGVLFERIRELVALTVISAREHMRTRLSRIKADTSGCFELLGFDCLVDAELNPWVLECNLSPSMEVCAAPSDGGDVEEQTKRKLLSDLVGLLGLNSTRLDISRLPPADRPGAEAEVEIAHSGDFDCVFPAADAARYLPCFPLPRLADMVLADAVVGEALPRPRVSARRTAEIISETGLQLYSEDTATLFKPNDTAAWIWLRATEGETPDNIADELIAAQRQIGKPVDSWEVRKEVWDVLADWAAAGLLIQDETDTPGSDLNNAVRESHGLLPCHAATGELSLGIGTGQVHLHACDQAVLTRLHGPFAPLCQSSTEHPGPAETFRILQGGRGYAIADERKLVAEELRLSQLAPVLSRLMLQGCHFDPEHHAMQGVLVPLKDVNAGNGPVPAAFLLADGPGMGALLALWLAHTLGRNVHGGVRIALAGDGAAFPVGLPLQIEQGIAGQWSQSSRARRVPLNTEHLHEWSADGVGYLLPSDKPALSVPHVIHRLLIPMDRDSPGTSDPSNGHRISAQDALTGLLPCCSGPDGQALSAESVLALTQWLEERDIQALPADNVELAIAALESLIQHDVPAFP